MSETISLDDFKSQIEDIVKELESNPEKINELTDEQAVEIDKYLNPYGATLYGDEKYTCVSFTNLKEKYMQKLLTTSLVGFLFQMVREHEVEDEDLNESYNSLLNKDDYYELSDHPDKNNSDFLKKFEESLYKEHKFNLIKSKIELLNNEDESKESEDNNEELRQFINIKVEDLTLDNLDQFTLSEDDELELRNKTNSSIEEKLQPTKFFNNEKYLEKKYELIQKQSQDEQNIINKFLEKIFKYDPKYHTSQSYNDNHNDPERIKPENNSFSNLTIPNDTYGRFQYYYDVNYEELREAVHYLYNDKPDMEVALNIYDTFNTLDECNEYINKNKDKVITNIMTLTNYKWNLLGSFKQNRDRITFYNENTQILENILKQQEEDAKMGKKLLDERIRKKKVKNVKEYGKTDPAVAKYLKENPNDITANAHKVDILEDKVVVTEEIEISESGAKVDNEGTPEDAIEIGVTSINLKDNKVSNTKIYTKAHAPEIQKK
jgi:hypothetical protein